MHQNKLSLTLMDYYTCEVFFAKKGWVRHSKGNSINKAPDDYGQAAHIVLKPADDAMPVVHVYPPVGSKAVFFRRRHHVTDDMQHLESLHVACGWRVGNAYCLKMVDMHTGDVQDVHENRKTS